SLECRKYYDEIIEINTCELFTPDDFTALQLALLKVLHRREIVIETLPTSNVRIGHHDDFSTYQLWNWIRWESEGNQIPPIVGGSDDTGFFATNIFNEYAHIYCYLTGSGNLSHHKAMEIIK